MMFWEVLNGCSKREMDVRFICKDGVTFDELPWPETLWAPRPPGMTSLEIWTALL
jgi:hypothetical protein